jgi:hypothetical protein
LRLEPGRDLLLLLIGRLLPGRLLPRLESGGEAVDGRRERTGVTDRDRAGVALRLPVRTSPRPKGSRVGCCASSSSFVLSLSFSKAVGSWSGSSDTTVGKKKPCRVEEENVRRSVWEGESEKEWMRRRVRRWAWGGTEREGACEKESVKGENEEESGKESVRRRVRRWEWGGEWEGECESEKERVRKGVEKESARRRVRRWEWGGEWEGECEEESEKERVRRRVRRWVRGGEQRSMIEEWRCRTENHDRVVEV